MASFWHSFFADDRVETLLVLIALDLALGVIVSVKNKNFRLSFVVDFARNDLLGKVAPVRRIMKPVGLDAVVVSVG